MLEAGSDIQWIVAVIHVRECWIEYLGRYINVDPANGIDSLGHSVEIYQEIMVDRHPQIVFHGLLGQLCSPAGLLPADP